MTAPADILHRLQPTPPPEPGLSADAVIARAVALRPRLRELAEENERRGHYGEDLHREFEQAGFYRLLMPRAFGGYEFDYSVFFRVMLEISRGHPSTGWCLLLAASHAPLVAAHWGEQAQREVFEGGRFIAPHRAAPGGHCERVAGGYLVDGVWPWSSGVPYATHFIGSTVLLNPQGPPDLLNFIVPRHEINILDDWGGDRTLGMKGSGSNSVRIQRVFVPAHRVSPMLAQYQMMDPSGTHGTRLHGNPMFLGITAAPYHCGLVTPTLGAALAALDEYHDLLLTQKTHLPPVIRRADDAIFQRCYGEATTMVDAAEAILERSAQRHMELCQRWQATGQTISGEEQLRLWGQLQRAGKLAGEAVEMLFQSAGSTAARQGSRMLRYLGDVQMYRGHMSAQVAQFGTYIGRLRLGLPSGFANF